jgi:PAS domain S-box-containing protein
MVVRRQLRSRSFLAWLGLGATLALTLLTWVQVRRADRRRVRERFEVELDTIAERIASRIRTEEEILLGASQFIAHDRTLPTSRQWMDYVQAMDLERLTPGIQAMGFAEWIPLPKVPSHVARMRAEGHPGYEVIPGGPLLPEDGVSSIIYTEPFNDLNHKVFAKDMLAETTRREALHRACDTGLTTLTGPVQLYQEGPTLNQAGALLYAPVYRQNTNLDTLAHRRGALLGWTYMAFRMQNLTEGILGGYGRGIHLELFDGASELPKDLLYTRQALRNGESNTWSTRRQLKVADRVWTLRGSPGTDFLASLEGGGLQLPLLLVGILSGIGIFALFQFLMRAERQALVLADGHLEKLQLILDSTGEGIYGIDLAGNCTFCNPAALRLLGYERADQLLGKHVHSLIHHSHPDGRPIPAEESGSFKAFQTELDIRVEDEPFWRADGTSFPVEYWSRPQWHQGQLVGAVVTFMDITERKRAEEALLASESMYRERLDYAGEGCAVTDAQERFLVVNPAAEEIFGVSPGRLLGRSLLEFLSLDQQDLVRRETMVRTKGNQSTYELEIRREDGVIRTLLITATRRPGLGDEGLQVIGVFRDITERKQAEADRQELANRLQKIASMVPGVVYQFLLRPDGSACFPYASEGLRNMFGYGPEEVREDASKVLALVHPDDQDSFINSIQDSARTLRPWKQEYRVQLAGGVIRTLLGHSVPQREKDGSVLWHGSVLDVTKRRDTARKLEEMVERLALATRAGGVGIWDFDVLGNQLKWDNQMYRLYGIRSTDFGGVYEAWRSGLHPDDAARGDAEIQLALKDEKDFDTEFRVVWPDGSIRHIRALALVQRDAAGRPLRMIGTNWDVTELKQAEEALRHLNQSLQLRVAEEVARRMEHERLLVHQSRLAAMGEMIGNIAHQWRQPLNALAMTLGNIKDARQYGQLTDDYLEASIRQGNAHIQRMSSTITDFMDYFRPGKTPGKFSLREQIRLEARRHQPGPPWRLRRGGQRAGGHRLGAPERVLPGAHEPAGQRQ